MDANTKNGQKTEMVSLSLIPCKLLSEHYGSNFASVCIYCGHELNHGYFYLKTREGHVVVYKEVTVCMRCGEKVDVPLMFTSEQELLRYCRNSIEKNEICFTVSKDFVHFVSFNFV